MTSTWKGATWLVLAAALVFHGFAWSEGGGLSSWAGFHQAMSWHGEPFADFTAVYYPMGKAVLEGARAPVQGFYYSPFAALCCAPFAALGEQASAWAWLAVLLAAALFVALMPLRWATNARERAVYLGLVLFSLPALQDLHWGQVSSLMMASVLGSLVLQERGHPRWAGALLGSAAAIKFFPGLFLLLLVARRQYAAFAVGTFMWMALGLGLPAALWGHDAVAFYPAIVEGLQEARQSLWRDAAAVQYIPAVAARWISSDPAGAPGNLWVLGGLIVFMASLAQALLVARRGTEQLAPATALLWLALPFALHPSWPHYFVFLPFAGLVVLRASGPSWAAWTGVLLSGALLSSPLFWALSKVAEEGAPASFRLGTLSAACLILWLLLSLASFQGESSRHLD